MLAVHLSLFPALSVAAGDNDVKKAGNTYLQVKLVLDKGVGTEEVFMGRLRGQSELKPSI